jgi:hypothetical protein
VADFVFGLPDLVTQLLVAETLSVPLHNTYTVANVIDFEDD